MQEITMARKTAAYKIHMDIMAAGEVAAESFSTFCKLLKTMRDDKLYVELEYSSFEAYCENAVGLKQRQAYNYIRALETFGEENLHSSAKIGIKKLELIGSAPEETREKLLDDAKEMTAREVEAAVKEYKSKLNEVQGKYNLVNFDKIKLEKELEQNKERVTKTNKYADEHMQRARDAELKLEKQETAMNALRFDLDNARKQLVDAKVKGDGDKIKRLQDTVIEQVDKLEKLEEEKAELQKQLHDKPIEIPAVRIVEVIPDEVRLVIYDKIAKLYEGLANLTYAEIKIFAAGVGPDYCDDVTEGLRKAAGKLDIIENEVNTAQNPVKEVAPEKDFDPDCNCGICKFADMDGVSEDELENNKTLCTESDVIVDFEYGCDRFESAIDH